MMSGTPKDDRGFEETVRVLGELETRRRGALQQGPHSEILAFARHAGDEFFRVLHERQLHPDLSKQEAITLGLCVRGLTTFYAIVDMLELSLSLQALAIHRSLRSDASDALAASRSRHEMRSLYRLRHLASLVLPQVHESLGRNR